MKKVLLSIFLGLLPVFAFSQIQLNEIFADNGDCCLDDSLETEDFIEIINMGSSPIDIAGYYFGDQDGGSTIPSGYPELTTISSGGLLLLWFDNDTDQGPLHIGSKLNNDGETIIGVDNEGNTIINVTYGPQSEDVSFASFPDGQPFDSEWAFTMCPTPGELNNSCPLIEGCTSINATNYNNDATIEDGSCVFGSFNGLMINEYSAANCDTDGSDCGDYEDWIEIFNNTSQSINLEGYYLSDKIDNLTKWQFPNTLLIEPGDYQIIYASGLDPNLEISDTNTSFKLTQTKNSEYIILSSPTLGVVDYKKLNNHQLQHSFGRSIDGGPEWSVFAESTPGSSNSGQIAYNSYVSTPNFNFAAGFYSDELSLDINCNSSNVEIYYTLDGSVPDSGSSFYGYIDANGVLTTLNSSIIINNTTVVKAIAIS